MSLMTTTTHILRSVDASSRNSNIESELLRAMCWSQVSLRRRTFVFFMRYVKELWQNTKRSQREREREREREKERERGKKRKKRRASELKDGLNIQHSIQHSTWAWGTFRGQKKKKKITWTHPRRSISSYLWSRSKVSVKKKVFVRSFVRSIDRSITAQSSLRAFQTLLIRKNIVVPWPFDLPFSWNR